MPPLTQSLAPRRGKPRVDQNAKVYLVGGGIASMAAAAFMIRDGDIAGHQITILEELDVLGGSLDGSGSAQNGYVVRGGRMLESKYLCTCSPRSRRWTAAARSPRRSSPGTRR